MSFQPNAAAGGSSGVTFAVPLGGLPRIIARTTDSATRSATTTLADDTVLVFPIAANEVWRIDTYTLIVAANGGGTASTDDLKVGFSQPAGCAGNWGSVGAYAAELPAWSGMGLTGTPLGLLNSGSMSSALTANELGLAMTGVWVNGATPGNIGFQWAQNVSGASTILVARGSHMMGWRLE